MLGSGVHYLREKGGCRGGSGGAGEGVMTRGGAGNTPESNGERKAWWQCEGCQTDNIPM